MTISRRIGIGYAVMSAVGILMLVWLWYHEFVEEPREFSARGVPDIHKDTAAEFMTICFLGAMPVLLGLGWWWTRRALRPLRILAERAAEIESTKLALNLPLSGRNDEVDTLTSVLAATTARLETSFREIREFTLHASHELKTPLTVMRAELETVLREGAGLAPGQREWVESLLDEVIRLAGVVDSLTLLAKSDAAILAFERKAVALEPLLREAFEDAQALGEARRLNVSLESAAKPAVIGDRHRLRQLLLILIDNAVKYNRDGGTIEMALAEKDGFAEFRIKNTGGAIPPETQKRLFRRFARGAHPPGQVEGSGLGLSIARSIAEAHGGTISLEPVSAEENVAMVRLPAGGLTA